MSPNILRFLALLFVGLALGGSLAHLYELSNKIHLSAENYLTVQQIYRGWNVLIGALWLGELLSLVSLTIVSRGENKTFIWTLMALICFIGANIVFWMFTYPANRQTNNWTMLPGNWLELRNQWEYSHAAGAVLQLLSFLSLTISVLIGRRSS